MRFLVAFFLLLIFDLSSPLSVHRFKLITYGLDFLTCSLFFFNMLILYVCGLTKYKNSRIGPSMKIRHFLNMVCLFRIKFHDKEKYFLWTLFLRKMIDFYLFGCISKSVTKDVFTWVDFIWKMILISRITLKSV